MADRPSGPLPSPPSPSPPSSLGGTSKADRLLCAQVYLCKASAFRPQRAVGGGGDISRGLISPQVCGTTPVPLQCGGWAGAGAAGGGAVML